MPDFTLEQQYKGFVAGVDEVGRGSLAGSVVAAAVIFPAYAGITGIDDSKKLSASKRIFLSAEIMTQCHVGIGEASVAEIDQLNILQASLLAMQRAIAALPVIPDYVLVDGNRLPALPCPAQAVIKGDSISMSIAAASIVAKVHRDAMMQVLHPQYPYYGWDRNAGYPTAGHLAGLIQHGVSSAHRRSFAPVHAILNKARAA